MARGLRNPPRHQAFGDHIEAVANTTSDIINVFSLVQKWVRKPQTRTLAIFEPHQTEEKPSLTFSNTQLAALLKLAPQHLQRFAFNVSRATDTFFTTAASRFGKGLLQVILRLALLLLSNLTSPSVFSFR